MGMNAKEGAFAAERLGPPEPDGSAHSLSGVQQLFSRYLAVLAALLRVWRGEPLCLFLIQTDG